jgi:uncharacterized protein with von Willebrand factor type A (vWA) domain
MERDLVAHLARFGGALRSRGVAVTPADEADAAAALTLVDVADRREVFEALGATYKVRPGDRAVFAALFEQMWSGRGGGTGRGREDAAAPRRGGGPAPRSQWGPSSPGAGATSGTVEPEGEEPGYSPEALLMRKPFEECAEPDLVAMERLLERLALRLATRKSRRLVPSLRGRVDLRRSFGRLVRHRAEPVVLAMRSPAVETPKLVVLCDTSGSMQRNARFLLAFLLSLRRASRSAEVFSFNTELTRLTPWLSSSRPKQTLELLAAGVPDWAGGTRIGECLWRFAERYADSLVDHRTVVVVMSDGLDRGDVDLLSRAMRVLHARSRKVIWLNPLMGDERYRPEARGMAAALPWVDVLAPAHNLESLERLVRMVAA